jgi:Protein of unknown function (DUF2490)
MRRAIAGVLLLIALCAATDAGAQTATDERIWFNLTLQDQGGTASPWHWSMEFILRSRDVVEALDSSAIRPTISYNLTPRASVGGGYLIGRTDPVAGRTTTEHRFFGQFAWRSPAAGGTLSLRTRLEDRVIVDDTAPVARLRQQVRFSRPISRGNKLSWVAYEELFLNLNASNRYRRGVDHNRAFAGFSGALSSRLRVDFGYLNQFIPGHAAPDRMNHILSGTLVVSF